jgi:hypothetical protein
VAWRGIALSFVSLRLVPQHVALVCDITSRRTVPIHLCCSFCAAAPLLTLAFIRMGKFSVVCDEEEPDNALASDDEAEKKKKKDKKKKVGDVIQEQQTHTNNNSNSQKIVYRGREAASGLKSCAFPNLIRNSVYPQNELRRVKMWASTTLI